MTSEPMTTENRTDTEPCSDCGSPLAADQRYCLNCGARRGEPRVDYAPYVDPNRGAGSDAEAPRPLVAPVPVADPASTPPQRDASPLVAVAGVALLGLMLMVGVLIGKGGDPETMAAAPPSVVTVGDGTSVADSGAADTAQTASNNDTGGGKDDKADEPTGDPGSTDNPVTADRGDLEALENTSGQDYQDAAEELPDTIALPGEPPPTDNEDPGGGTDATVIK